MPLFWQHTYSVDTISYLYIFTALSVPNSQPKTHVCMQYQQTLTRLKAINKSSRRRVMRLTKSQITRLAVVGATANILCYAWHNVSITLTLYDTFFPPTHRKPKFDPYIQLDSASAASDQWEQNSDCQQHRGNLPFRPNSSARRELPTGWHHPHGV